MNGNSNPQKYLNRWKIVNSKRMRFESRWPTYWVADCQSLFKSCFENPRNFVKSEKQTELCRVANRCPHSLRARAGGKFSEIRLSNRSFPVVFPHRYPYWVFAKDTEIRIYVRKMPSAKFNFGKFSACGGPQGGRTVVAHHVLLVYNYILFFRGLLFSFIN